MMGTIANDANKFLSYDPNSNGSGFKSLMWPGYIPHFAKDFMGMSVQSADPTYKIGPDDKYVIGMVHESVFLIAI